MRARHWLLLFGFCALVTASLAFYKYRQISAAIAYARSFPEPAEAVVAARAEALTWQPTVTATAEVIAVLDVALTNELPGRIVALGFGPGEAVSKGQLLVKLDTREEEAQLQSAQAEARLAELRLRRNQTLAASGAASAEARDLALAQQASALARVEQLAAIIDKQALRAPFDGMAGLHELAVGQYLEAGTVLTRLVGSAAGTWIDFSLPQDQARLQHGDSVILSAPGLLDRPVTATVIARDAWVDRRSRHVRYRASPAPGSPVLMPGSFLTVTAPAGAAVTATQVPSTALRRDAYGSHVFVLTPDPGGAGERAHRRPVVAGAETAGLVVIQSGLEPDERVAADGAFKLRDGSLVKAAAEAGTP